MKNKETNMQELVEVKGVTLVDNNIALFPDAPTKRGARHVKELGEAVEDGWCANVVFIIKRKDAISFKPYQRHSIDQDTCTKCGNCIEVCPTGSVQVV